MRKSFVTIYVFMHKFERDTVRVIFRQGIFLAEDRWDFAKELLCDRLSHIDFGRCNMNIFLREGGYDNGRVYSKITKAVSDEIVEKIRCAMVKFCLTGTEVCIKQFKNISALCDNGVNVDQPDYLTLSEHDGEIVEFLETPDDGLNWLRKMHDDSPGGLTEDEAGMIGY
ncbi:hypothetical protein A2662_01020 [Candidatus Giovannonibacteria bacterium RIFCSPHIGHO2_01_FULL_45_33]|nr:MAG: hypothetical protein A2662_01020 [Candidatus Giovannonibacteria bacterium RIFCSPHIGHO2_01_FULL_45_33]